ncbi:MAG: SpoIIE family protein phosphatase [Frankia sp.]|nr:SpoIIE family protein phosphatase [Frankia sp.]
MTESITLTTGHEAARTARRHVARALQEAQLDDLVGDAQTVVTELVTNALLHGAPPVQLAVQVNNVVARIEVFDSSRATPVRGRIGGEGMTGRGLLIVEALASQWGVQSTAHGKAVWAELPAGAPVDRPELSVDELITLWSLPDDAAAAERTDQLYDVHLAKVPTDLLLAAKTHVDNLVREFTLATAGAESGLTAQVPEHLAELIDSVVRRFSIARQEIKRQALDAAARGLHRVALNLQLPLSAADAAQDYLHALDEADAYCRAARLLTLESPPQYRVFRRWYVEELVSQLRRAAAGEPRRSPRSFESRLLAELDLVTAAQRLADRAARLHRVAAALGNTMTAEGVAKAIVEEGTAALDADAGGVLVPNPRGRLLVPGAVGYDPDVLAQFREESLETELPAATAMRTGESVWVESVEERDERFPQLVSIEPSTQSVCAVPVVVGTQRIGALRFSFSRPHLFDEDERDFVVALAAQTAQALDRARAVAAERDAADRLEFLANASAELASSLDYNQTLAKLAQLAVPRFADWCGIAMVDDGRIHTVAVAHVDPEKVTWAWELNRRYPATLDDPSGVPNVIRTGAAEIYADITEDMLTASARDDDHLALVLAMAPTSAMIAPITTRAGTIGAITMILSEGDLRYDEADLAFAKDFARRAALAIENAQLYARTAEVGRTLQRGLLPPRLPAIPGVEVAAAYEPASEGLDVGGDFYDVWTVDANTWAFAIGDVCGTGAEAAALTAIVRYTLRTLTMVDGGPESIMARLNEALLQAEAAGPEGERFCTAVFGLLRSSGPDLDVELVSGGHPPALLRHADGVEELAIDGTLLGVLHTATVDSRRFSMKPGETLVLYTDGVIEARAADGSFYGAERLAKVIQEAGPTPAAIVDAVRDDVISYGARTADDVAILAISRPAALSSE